MVFDEGANTKNESLNNHLSKGTDMLGNLVSVLLKFRQRKYHSCDITQMFYQIRVLPNDCDALSFLCLLMKIYL